MFTIVLLHIHEGNIKESKKIINKLKRYLLEEAEDKFILDEFVHEYKNYGISNFDEQKVLIKKQFKGLDLLIIDSLIAGYKIDSRDSNITDLLQNP